VILVDTSVWIEHFRRTDHHLVGLLNRNEVVMHPFVLGEIALGNLKPREPVLQALADLPGAEAATDDEVLAFVNAQSLFGLGIGYVDVHLLAAARLSPGTRLWSYEERLAGVADRLGVGLVLEG
jgi:predicted nucleic acid-binding protein